MFYLINGCKFKPGQHTRYAGKTAYHLGENDKHRGRNRTKVKFREAGPPETSLENLSEVFLIAETNTESGLLDAPDEAALNNLRASWSVFRGGIHWGKGLQTFQAAVQLPFAGALWRLSAERLSVLLNGFTHF